MPIAPPNLKRPAFAAAAPEMAESISRFADVRKKLMEGMRAAGAMAFRRVLMSDFDTGTNSALASPVTPLRKFTDVAARAIYPSSANDICGRGRCSGGATRYDGGG